MKVAKVPIRVEARCVSREEIVSDYDSANRHLLIDFAFLVWAAFGRRSMRPVQAYFRSVGKLDLAPIDIRHCRLACGDLNP